jgi:hypothetical protein
MEGFNWTCPFCNRHATITTPNIHTETTLFVIKNADGPRQLFSKFIVCPNPECKKFTLTLVLSELTYDRTKFEYTIRKILKYWKLIPPSNAKPFPSYIPKAILDDYNEACAIKDLSPKASATLARRCLQGILRDFWKVKPRKLIDEIEDIKDKTDTITWDAIESVRKVGNIGAHMEKDINLIIDVDPQEAELFIGLIETLLQDWYVAKEERKKRLAQIKTIAADKQQAKKKT